MWQKDNSNHHRHPQRTSENARKECRRRFAEHTERLLEHLELSFDHGRKPPGSFGSCSGELLVS